MQKFGKENKIGKKFVKDSNGILYHNELSIIVGDYGGQAFLNDLFFHVCCIFFYFYFFFVFPFLKFYQATV